MIEKMDSGRFYTIVDILRALSFAQWLLKWNASIWCQREPTHMWLTGSDGLKLGFGQDFLIFYPVLEVDFVSRYFAPWNGIPEDPVNGSSHTNLIPLWSKLLNKKILKVLESKHFKLYVNISIFYTYCKIICSINRNVNFINKYFRPKWFQNVVEIWSWSF